MATKRFVGVILADKIRTAALSCCLTEHLTLFFDADLLLIRITISRSFHCLFTLRLTAIPLFLVAGRLFYLSNMLVTSLIIAIILPLASAVVVPRKVCARRAGSKVCSFQYYSTLKVCRPVFRGLSKKVPSPLSPSSSGKDQS